MKKMSTLIIVLLISIISKAQQIQEGNILLGGIIGFNNTTRESTGVEEQRNTSINFSPSVGKFYRANRVAGINLNYSHVTTNDESLKGNDYGLGFFLRQYLPVGKSFYVFAEENVFGQTGKSTQYLNSRTTRIETKGKGVSLNLYPGVAYAITRKFQAELSLTNLLSLGYTDQKRLTDNNGTISEEKTKNIALNAGANNNALGYLSVGAKWFLGKR
jgi:hypothetical protein